jgi:hypothetical protein
MSRADDSYDPSEMAAIKIKMNTLFAEGTNLEKKLYGAIREYNSFDKSKLTELFTGSILHFSKNSNVDKKLFNDLKRDNSSGWKGRSVGSERACGVGADD